MRARLHQSNRLIAMRSPDLFECEGNRSRESSETCLGSSRRCFLQLGSLKDHPSSVLWARSSAGTSWHHPMERHAEQLQLRTWPHRHRFILDHGWNFQKYFVTRGRNPLSSPSTRKHLGFAAKFGDCAPNLGPFQGLS